MPSTATRPPKTGLCATPEWGDDSQVMEDGSIIPGPSFYARQPDEAANYAKRVPVAYRGIYKRAMAGGSKAFAGKAKCLDCCGWQREEVALCTTLTCPLWKVRPYQKRAGKARVAE